MLFLALGVFFFLVLVLVLGLFLALGVFFFLVLVLVLGLFLALGVFFFLVLVLVLGLFLALGVFFFLVLVLVLGLLVTLGFLVVLAFGLFLLGVLGLALFLLHDLVVAADDLAVVDLAAPALELVLLEDRAGHDVAPEVPQLRTCPAALRPPDVSGLLEEALRVVLQDHQDPRQVGRQLVEGDRTVHVALLALGPPDDAVIGHLVDDRGLPGAV